MSGRKVDDSAAAAYVADDDDGGDDDEADTSDDTAQRKPNIGEVSTLNLQFFVHRIYNVVIFSIINVVCIDCV